MKFLRPALLCAALAGRALAADFVESYDTIYHCLLYTSDAADE